MNRIFKKTAIIILCSMFFICGCEEFFRRCIGGFAGCYPFVESWVIDAKERDVVDAIREIQIEDSIKHNEKIEVLNILKRDTVYDWQSNEMLAFRQQQEKDSTTPLPKFNVNNSMADYWLFINFYYKDTKQRVRSWIRPEFDSSKTTLALVSISSLEDYDQYKLINEDFWYFENKKQIEKFKTLIVDKINIEIKNKNKK